ncbi:MAG TPA: AAA family ATPase [Pseudonocardiaceae bacterium]|nr:AAA family ATPase [Pseudonocardiaceae bacterium]
MTGRYEEPAPKHDAAWQNPPSAQVGQAEPQRGADQSGPHPVNQQPGQSQPTEQPAPQQGGQHAAPEPHPTPSYVDPTGSGGFPLPGSQSGPYYVDPNNAGQPDSSGPYYVEPAGSGGFPAQGGPFPQPPPYHVPGGPSGPHHVEQQPPPGYYPQQGQQRPTAFPFQQQFPQGGPNQPPPPMPPGQRPQGQPPGSLSRQAMAAAHELSSTHLIKQTKRPPQSGWRRAVYKATGHAVNMGESPADVHRRDLIGRINQPLRGCYKIAMLSLKGGVGKTTMTTTLGSTFASLRGDRVIAVDANPDRGTLSQKIPLETTATVRHLLRDAGRITRYSDVRAYTSQGPSRLEVLASEQDPAVSEAFSEADYRRTIDLLEHFYNIVLTDCGTGLMHSAMRGVLDIADSLVVVSSGSVDGARSASATLDWLDAHGYHDLVARSVAVINSVRPRSGAVDLERLAEHFGSRCRAVCRIPFDPHLEEGAEIELDRLAPQTRTALLELGATVADDFPSDLSRR